MNNLEEKLAKLQHISLTDDERAVLRIKLEQIVKNPIEDTAPTFDLGWIKVFYGAAVPIGLFLLMFGFSANALPGQPLYAFKTEVKEPISRIAAIGVDSRLEYEQGLIKERVSEAKELKAKGVLDVELSADLENKISEHAEAAEEVADEKIEDPKEASTINSKIIGQANGSKNAIRFLAGQDLVDEAEDVLPITTEDEAVQPILEIPVDIPVELNASIETEAKTETTAAQAATETAIERVGLSPESNKAIGFIIQKTNDVTQKVKESLSDEELLEAIEESTEVQVIADILNE